MLLVFVSMNEKCWCKSVCFLCVCVYVCVCVNGISRSDDLHTVIFLLPHHFLPFLLYLWINVSISWSSWSISNWSITFFFCMNEWLDFDEIFHSFFSRNHLSNFFSLFLNSLISSKAKHHHDYCWGWSE